MRISVHMIASVNMVNRFLDQPGSSSINSYVSVSVHIKSIYAHICVYQTYICTYMLISVHISLYPYICMHICLYFKQVSIMISLHDSERKVGDTCQESSILFLFQVTQYWFLRLAYRF